ncbi:MAG: hypothetical protein H0W70_05795 [Actinobacteria bacterium]|nr:hypothetical protein [Actinomycetota bacterium]
MKRRAWLLLGALALLPACSTRGYAFKVDESIDMTAPEARSSVSLPVTITWVDHEPPANLAVDIHDPDSRYYGVFLDRSPIGPGRTLRSVVAKTDSCRRTPNCPDIAYLHDRKIFLTSEPTLTLELLQDLRASKRATKKDPHEATVVRMQGDRRVGEASFRLNFFVKR